MHRDIFRLKNNRETRFEPRCDQILDHFLLRVNRDGLASGQVVKVDAMAAAVESQLDAVMGESFAFEALPDARFDEQIDRALFEQACANALFDVFPGARFENHGFNSLQVEQVSEHQSRRTCPDNADLRAHVLPFVRRRCFLDYAQFRHTRRTLSMMRMNKMKCMRKRNR